MAPEVDNPVIRQAEAFGRLYVDTIPELRDLRPIFDAILARTRSEEAPELKNLFADLDERTLRRRVETLREWLEEISREQKFLWILSVEEGRAGHQTSELKRTRHTFLLHANTELHNFYLRKWYSPVFPNTPGVEPLKAALVYPTIDQGDRILASQGDLQLTKHITRALWMNGAECDDMESWSFKDDPDEADRHLILTGNETSNHVIAQVTRDGELALRCLEDGVTDGKQRVWRDGPANQPRSVHALVTVCKSKWTNARLWIFESYHDRALEAVGRFFSDTKKIASLAAELNLSPADEFPATLQLVFTVDVNRQNQLRGAEGGIRLAHSSYKAPPPRFPVATQEKPVSNVVPMKKRRA